MFATSQQKAYSKIKTMILEGEFRSGERIPETKVAELIGMKRGPVRESMIKLESDGLLVSEPHFGFAVRKYTIDEARQLYELREFIEGGAAGLAAKNAKQADIDHLLRTHQAFKDKIEKNKELLKMEDAPEECSSNSNHDEAFHRAILRSSRNSRFANVFDNINDEHICLTLYCKGEKFNKFHYDIESLEHHKIILDAIVNHDAKTAEAEARLHVRRAMKGLLMYFETLGEDIYFA